MQNIYGFQLFESISIYNFSFFVGVYMYPILLNIQRSRSIVYTIPFMISGGAQNYTVYMMLYNVYLDVPEEALYFVIYIIIYSGTSNRSSFFTQSFWGMGWYVN